MQPFVGNRIKIKIVLFLRQLSITIFSAFKFSSIAFSTICLMNVSASAATEIGFSYSYMKRYMDALNITETQSLTGSFSFYFWERIALELSYTNGLYVKKEKELSLTNPDSQRTTTQKSDVSEMNIIFLLSGKQSRIQPYVKGGVAHIKKYQTIQIDGSQTYTVTPKPGLGPSAGVGLKIFVTEELAIRLSADAIRTPIDDTSYAEDMTIRAGLSWML